MAVQAPARTGRQAPSGPARPVAYAGAAALIVAAAWYALAAGGVTVTAAPDIPAALPASAQLHLYYRWLVTTLPQERFYLALAMAGLICLAMTAAAAARALAARQHSLALTGAICVAAGAAAWVTGALIELGGHRAVGLMATHRNPIQATNSISFTIDMLVQAFDLAAFAFLGAGMLSFGWLGYRQGRRPWAVLTLLLAAFSLVAAWSYGAGDGTVTDVAVIVAGAAGIPAWLIWTARLATPASLTR